MNEMPREGKPLPVGRYRSASRDLRRDAWLGPLVATAYLGVQKRLKTRLARSARGNRLLGRPKRLKTRLARSARGNRLFGRPRTTETRLARSARGNRHWVGVQERAERGVPLRTRRLAVCFRFRPMVGTSRCTSGNNEPPSNRVVATSRGARRRYENSIEAIGFSGSTRIRVG